MTDYGLLEGVDRSELRKEASLYGWGVLTRDQQRAVLSAHRRFTMLADLRYAPQAKKEGAAADVEKFLPSLERETNAVNRVVLIDGGRGSGKTVVLMRLLQFWSDRHRTTPKYALEPEFVAAIHTLEAEMHDPSGATSAGSALAQRSVPPIVPIGFIQLTLLEDSANLLTYLSSHLFQVIRAIDESGSRSRAHASPWTTVEDSGSRLSQAWNKYLQAIAHASGDQGSERKKTLDPETWALELRDAEFHRRDISDHFNDLMEAIVEEFRAKFTRDRDPLFVIAIDDADMRPQHSVKLLNVIRQLNHPRVAFILTGETPLFVRMLTDSYLGRLRSPLRSLDLEDNAQEQLKDREFASRLARDVFDKVVPPPQRYQLPELEERERVELMKRKPHFAALSFFAETLPHLLDGSDATGSAENRTLLSYCEKNAAVAAALPPRLREITAFGEYLEAQRRTAIEAVEWIWRRTVDRADLEPRDQDRLKRMVRREPGLDGLIIETYSFRSEVVPRTILPRRPIGGRWSMLLRGIDSYELSYAEELLPEEVTAAFLLASDIAADGVQSDFLGRSVSPKEFRAPFVTVTYSARDYHSYDFVWPLPDWDGFIDFELFSTGWRRLLQKEGLVSERLTRDDTEWDPGALDDAICRVARMFIGLAIDVCDSRSEARSDEPRSWDVLADQIATLKEVEWRRGPYRRNRHIAEWATSRAVLLAAPESGLPPGDANTWLDALWAREIVDKGGAKRGREARAKVSIQKQLLEAKAENVDALLGEISTSRARDHHPGFEFERRLGIERAT